MDTQTSLMIFQFIYCLGSALWLNFILINNLQASVSSMGTIGVTMLMAPLAQPSAIDIPLLTWAVHSPLIHRLASSITVVLQVAAVTTAWADCYELLFGTGLETTRPQLNLVLSAALGFLFDILLSGLWFDYWIRQEGLQLIHLPLVVWVLANFFVFNIRWSRRGLSVRGSRAQGRRR